MQEQTGITIASKLDLQNMRCAADMPCHAVLDLRFTNAANARPVEEEIVLRLRNLQIGYEQLPVDLQRPDGLPNNDLTQRITESRGRMMIITDQPEAVSAFCSDIARDTRGSATHDSARAVPHHQLSEAA